MTELAWEIVGFVGFLTNIVGNLLLAWKRRGGWPIRLIPNVCWAAYAIEVGMLSLLANSITFFVINCLGWWKWTRTRDQA